MWTTRETFKGHFILLLGKGSFECIHIWGNKSHYIVKGLF